MKYIVCEDTRSGYFFWQQINQVFFNGECIVKAKRGIGDLLKFVSSVAGDENSYLVCFDNCTDNKELRNSVSALRKIERQWHTKF